MRFSFTRRAALGALIPFGWPVGQGQAQSLPGAWPLRGARIVVPYPAGGSPDLLVRTVAEQLGQTSGQSFVVENKPGASGLLGARVVSRAQPDGRSLVYLSSAHITLQAMNPSFQLLKEFVPITQLTLSPFVCVVKAEAPFETIQALQARLAQPPGSLSYATAGAGSPSHMAVMSLAERLPMFRKALHVPFKGAVESINAILGDQITFSIVVLGTALPHLRSGRLRALAITSTQRSASLPNVVTFSESVAPGFVYESFGGLAMHAQTPLPVVNSAFRTIVQACHSQAVQTFAVEAGSRVELSASIQAFAAQIARDAVVEARQVRDWGILAGS